MGSSRVGRAGKAPRGKGLVSAAAPSRIAPPGLDSTSLPCSQAIWDAAVAHSPPPACLDPGFSRGQLPICLPQEAGNEFRVLLRWRAKPLLSPISSYYASDSLVTPQGREPWPEEATPNSSHACPWAGRAGRALILAPPGCLVCHSLPSSGTVRSGPAGTWKILATAHLAEPQLCSWPGFPLPLRTAHPGQAPVLGAPQRREQNCVFPSPHEHGAPAKTPHS